MTTIGMTQDRHQTISDGVRRGSMVRQALLWSGVLSSLLYIAADILGGLQYQGYSFTGQAISELGAIGAPSKPFVDPLFMVYNLLALAFGIGVFRVAAGRNRALRITGVALTGYGVIGIAASLVGSFFAMHQRGTSTSVASDSPHIILTAILVLLLVVAMGFGAFALNRQFRLYSLATITTVIAFGALTALYAPRVAAGQATPGMGVLERIDVYSCMLWLALLAIALLRRPASRDGGLLP